MSERYPEAQELDVKALEDAAVALILAPTDPAPKPIADAYDAVIDGLTALTGETRSSARIRMLKRAGLQALL